MAGPSPKKKPGDSAFNNNKKRRKNETPPPSRRPQGPPNVPPPKPVLPPQVKNLNSKPVVSTKDTPIEIVDENERKDIAEEEEIKEKEVEKIEPAPKIVENGISTEKKVLGKSVNKQLKKLQEMHKNKLSKIGKIDSTEVGANKEALVNYADSPSPILSILRTSFNEEKGKVTEAADDASLVETGKKRKLEGDRKHNANIKRARHSSESGTGGASFDSKSTRLQLQQYRNTKLRLAAWKEIRNPNREYCGHVYLYSIYNMVLAIIYHIIYNVNKRETKYVCRYNQLETMFRSVMQIFIRVIQINSSVLP